MCLMMKEDIPPKIVTNRKTKGYFELTHGDPGHFAHLAGGEGGVVSEGALGAIPPFV